jgi:phospho-N-acetylmuramoyl-pentapeptide-transferase
LDFFGTIPIQHRFLWVIGSLTIGGIIAVLAIAVRNADPFIVRIFLVENLSVVLQVSYFKYTKKRFGEGRRIFLMSPLHHHYQERLSRKQNCYPFWIVAIMLAILSIVTLKLR